MPHDVFGTFAIWLCQVVVSGGESAAISRALALMNDMAESEDDEVVNLLEVSVFEILVDHPECVRRRSLLHYVEWSTYYRRGMATSTDTRTRFVEAAAQLLHERGYEGMSLGEVISRSGAPRGSLYYHFPGGKDELVCEAARLGVEHVSKFLRECFAPDANPVRAVRRYAVDAARELEESGFIFGCPVAPIVLDGVASAELRVICREALATWQQIIAERLRMAGLSAARARSFAGLAVSAVEGALLVARARRDIAPLEEVGSELAAQLAATLPDKEDAHE